MTASLTESAARQFAAWQGAAPAGVVFAPGRVNLIGEHLDYNDGIVLPMPIREGTAIAWRPRQDGRIVVRAADAAGEDSFAVTDPARLMEVDWRSYVRGIVAALAAPDLAGADLLITGNLPRGVGLSSSASLCVAVGRALLAASGRDLDAVTLAQAAQTAEHVHAGVACGIMDQMAVAAGQAGQAMQLDCRGLQVSHHPLPPDWAVLIVDSGVSRALADGAFNRRRAECEAAARALGVAALRDALPAQLGALPAGSSEWRRAAHVVAEIARVKAAVAAIASGDIVAMGKLLRDGHASLSTLFEVTLPALDALAADINARLGGDGGARLTGAGFGGSLVVVLPRRRATGLAAELGATGGRPVLAAF